MQGGPPFRIRRAFQIQAQEPSLGQGYSHQLSLEKRELRPPFLAVIMYQS